MPDSNPAPLAPEQLLRQLGQRLGIEGLSFSEAGLCELLFDGGLRTVTLHAGGQWISAVQLEQHPLSPGDPLAEQALSANFLWRATHGATLALDGERRLWAQRAPDRGTPDANSLLANLERLLDMADAWRRRESADTARPIPSQSPSLLLNRA